MVPLVQYKTLQFRVTILCATGSKFWRGSNIILAITAAVFYKGKT